MRRLIPVVVLSALLGTMVLPHHSPAKVRSDFLYLLFYCVDNYSIYVDGRILKPPFKVKLYKDMPRVMEIRTSDGVVYLGSVEALPTPKDRTGKTFGYTTCITQEILSKIVGETRIYVKDERNKPVARIKLKRVQRGR